MMCNNSIKYYSVNNVGILKNNNREYNSTTQHAMEQTMQQYNATDYGTDSTTDNV